MNLQEKIVPMHSYFAFGDWTLFLSHQELRDCFFDAFSTNKMCPLLEIFSFLFFFWRSLLFEKDQRLGSHLQESWHLSKLEVLIASLR